MPETKLKSPKEIQVQVHRVLQLQALPQCVQDITRTLNSPVSTADDVAREIAKDPSFSAQVLKLVNSGFYGFTHPIASIAHATVLLGFSVMKTLVMSASVMGLLSRSVEGLWEHSLACARACAQLSRTLSVDEPEEVSAVGLLHDIGKMVLAEYLRPEFDAVMAAMRQDDLLLVEAERKVLGVTHAEIARWLLKKWNLPPDTVEPIAMHHTFTREGAFVQRTALVHLADVLVQAAGYGAGGGEPRLPGVDHAALAALDIGRESLPGIVDEIMVELEETA